MNPGLRILIVDDEPLARQAVRLLLAGDPEVTVVGECGGVDAAARIVREQPDVVFLDLQMPEVDGFDVIEQVGPERLPAIVFVTAHGDHALRAFDAHALDYVLKPIDDSRFAQALARAKEQARLKRQGAAVDAGLGALLAERSRYARRFLVRTREKTIVVQAEEIDWIEAADYYVALHLGGVSHLLRETMSELEQRLDPERFFRAHRSAIVNLERVREIHPLFRGDCDLVLDGGARVRLSRTRRAEFERLLGAKRE